MPHRTAFDSLFTPRTVAVIGATDREGSVGHTLLANLGDGSFKGAIYPVNPKREQINGLCCYARIGDVPEKIDLALIVTPAVTVPALVGECVSAGVAAAVVISAGFKERGPEGAELERQIQRELCRGKMRLIGPNCLGIMNPVIGLNATFSHDAPRPGNVAFLSQSGALLTAILDWSLQENVGFSSIVSTGSMLDVGWGDLISYFGEDPHTQSILLYLESVGDARSFLSATREVALRKPIIVIKAGRSEAASRAASSHTGALTGSDEVFDAALRRCGVLRVQNISDLFYMAEVLARQPRPKGPRLMILTNAGGPGVLATDALIAQGGELAPLSAQSSEALSQFLSPHWSHNNPIDVLGDATPEQYAKALEIAIADPGSDGLLAILAPQGMTDPAGVAEGLKPYARGTGKPVLASWMGGNQVAEGIRILNEAGVPTFSYPDTAARMFELMWRYTYNLRGIYETPGLADDVEGDGISISKIDAMLQSIRESGRTTLTEPESKSILSLAGIPTVPTRVAEDESQAAKIAAELGYPVVLKLLSQTITHKTDVGGVKLNLQNEESVRSAFRAIEAAVTQKAGRANFQGVTVQPMVRVDGYELILGSSLDAQFGPVVLFGSGGQLVEVYRDHALALPPLNSTLAQRLMEQTRIYRALQGVRGRAGIDMPALERVLIRFSRLVVEQPCIKEIDINPLLAAPERLVALDARIILHGPDVAMESLSRPAIRPYPSQYVGRWTMKDGASVLIRPIRPEDEPAMVRFHESLSEQSVYLRFFHMEKLSSRTAHDRLMQKCFIDYDREMALIVEKTDGINGQAQILGVGRLSRGRDSSEAEVAVLITDRYQHVGLGTELVRRLIDIARDMKIEHILATIMPENMGMKGLARHFGFKIVSSDDPSLVTAVLDVTVFPGT